MPTHHGPESGHSNAVAHHVKARGYDVGIDRGNSFPSNNKVASRVNFGLVSGAVPDLSRKGGWRPRTTYAWYADQ